MSRQLSQLLAGREATGSGDVRPVPDAGTHGRQRRATQPHPRTMPWTIR